MSALSVFSKMNKKLEEGWKLTDAECPICKVSIVGNLKTKELYCVSCEMPVKISSEDDDTEVISNNNSNNKLAQEIEEFDNLIISRENDPKRKKADELSKKTGELLLQGWTMLGDSCFDCLFPLMRSKKGETICVGCGPVDKKKQVEEAIKEDKSPSSVVVVNQSGTKTNSVKEEQSYKGVDEPKHEKQINNLYKEEKKQKELSESENKDLKSIQIKSSANQIELLKVANFEESIAFYTRITQLLHQDIEKLSTQGLLANLDRVNKALETQIAIDNAKLNIINKLKE